MGKTEAHFLNQLPIILFYPSSLLALSILVNFKR
jgi:hypothetical protein